MLNRDSCKGSLKSRINPGGNYNSKIVPENDECG